MEVNGDRIQIWGQGHLYRTVSISTVGYQHITLEFDLAKSSDKLDSGEYAKLFYQIDNSTDGFLQCAEFDQDELTKHIIQFPPNSSDNIGFRFKFKNNGQSSTKDRFYIQNRLILTGTSPTLNPTTDPTFNTTFNPTLNPTFNPTLNPTFNPTFDPTSTPIFVQDTAWTNIQYIILCIVNMIFIGILIFLTICKFSKSDGLKIMKKIRIIAISQMIAYFLSYLFWMICIIILYNDNDNHLRFQYIFFSVLQYLFWIIGWVLFYISLIFKLYITFNQSHYKMSKKYIYFHTFIVCFIPIWYSIITISDELNIFNSKKFYFILSASGTILIFFGMLSLMISFNRNLFVIISAQRMSIVLSSNIITDDTQSDNSDGYRRSDFYFSDNDDDNNDDNISLNDRQIRMLDVVTKQTLLGSVMLFGGLVYLIMILSISISDHDKTTKKWIIYEWVLGVFININLFCIYFGWKTNQKEYKLFCGKCHSILILFCESLVRKNMVRKEKSSLSDNDLLCSAN